MFNHPYLTVPRPPESNFTYKDTSVFNEKYYVYSYTKKYFKLLLALAKTVMTQGYKRVTVNAAVVGSFISHSKKLNIKYFHFLALAQSK